MAFLDGLANVLTGGIADKLVDSVKEYFPSEEAKAKITLAAKEAEFNITIETNKAIAQAEADLTARIAQTEGTAADLKSIPVLGPIMLFLRGAQRPVWGFGTIWLDFQVFSGAWTLDNAIQNNTFWIINFLVLGFLFGERAMMNVMPMVTEMFKAKNGTLSKD